MRDLNAQFMAETNTKMRDRTDAKYIDWLETKVAAGTDFEIIRRAFELVGIPFEPEPKKYNGEPEIIKNGGFERVIDLQTTLYPAKIITIEEGDGYGGFFTEFWFDKDGKFLSHACLE